MDSLDSILLRLAVRFAFRPPEMTSALVLSNDNGVVVLAKPPINIADGIIRCRRCDGCWSAAFYQPSFHKRCPDVHLFFAEGARLSPAEAAEIQSEFLAGAALK